jgi:hypothetical protein
VVYPGEETKVSTTSYENQKEANFCKTEHKLYFHKLERLKKEDKVILAQTKNADTLVVM